jgi:hypothetical protein
MQFYNFALTIAAAIVAAKELNAPQGAEQKVINKVEFVHSKPEKHRRPCPPVHCDVCPFQMGDFFVLKNKVPFFKADCACREKGGVLAELNSCNFRNATKTAFNCIGCNNYAWVKSWNTDDYGNSCLALFTGKNQRDGAVSIPISCSNDAAVLCQKVHQHCDKPGHCHHFVWDWSDSEGLGDWVIPCGRNDHECHRWWNDCEHCKKPKSSGPTCQKPQMKILEDY